MSETSQNNDKKLVERKVIWKVCLEHLKDSTTGQTEKGVQQVCQSLCFLFCKTSKTTSSSPCFGHKIVKDEENNNQSC